MPSGFQVVSFIIGTIVIIVGAYYVTYYVGVKSSGARRGRKRNRNINMLDRFAISKDKSFCIVEIAGKVYVIGVTNQSMTVIDTLEAENFAEKADERAGAAAEAWQPTVVGGGGLVDRMTKKLAAFIAGKMKKKSANSGFDATFAGSMRTARGDNDRKDDTHSAR